MLLYVEYLTSLEKVLKNKSINVPLRYRLLKCYVWLTLSYGAEAWKLSADMLKNLEAAEIRNMSQSEKKFQSEYKQKASE